jgi:plastocyanin
VHVVRLLATTAAAASFALAACGDDDAVAGADASADAGTATMGSELMGDATTVTCVAGDVGDDEVAIASFTFRPAPLEVEAGASVTFTNQDATDHSVWSDERVDGDPAWESIGSDPAFRLPEVLHGGDSSTCTFPAAGTYEYRCGVHNSMTGSIVVR